MTVQELLQSWIDSPDAKALGIPSLTAGSITVTPTPPPPPPAPPATINSVYLFDIANRTIAAVLKLGMTLAVIPQKATIRVDGNFKSVRFQLSGPVTIDHTEGLAPYDLNGDDANGNAIPVAFPNGDYTLTLTPDVGALVKLTFTVNVPVPPPVPPPAPPPVPPPPPPPAVRTKAPWPSMSNNRYDLQPNTDYTLTATLTIDGPIYVGMSGIMAGTNPAVQLTPPRIIFNPTVGVVTPALRLRNGATVGLVDFVGNDKAQLFVAEKGTVAATDINIISGAGLGTMAGADKLTCTNIDGVAAANMLYVGAGAHSGKLVLRNFNLSGGMTNEHGLRTHLLDELDWDGGTFDGSGSVAGKDVLTIHELIKGGTIKNVHFKGWATIGGLTPASGGNNDKALVNNLTLQNVTFEPCIRASGAKNGARIYVLAGVNNLVLDTGKIVSTDGTVVNWTNDAGSATRKPPTGVMKNFVVTGPGSLVGGGAGGLSYKGNHNTFNGSAV